MISHSIFPVGLPVPSANYSGTYKTPTEGTQFTSGKFRRRKVGRTAVKQVTLEWLFSPDEFDLWEVFYREELNDGCNQFTLNMSTGGISQTGEHVIQCVEDYQFSHEECNWRVSVGCIIFPYPKEDQSALLEGYLGAPIKSFLDVMNQYYEEEYQQ